MLSEISLYNWDIDNKNNFMTCLLIYKGIIKNSYTSWVTVHSFVHSSIYPLIHSLIIYYLQWIRCYIKCQGYEVGINSLKGRKYHKALGTMMWHQHSLGLRRNFALWRQCLEGAQERRHNLSWLLKVPWGGGQPVRRGSICREGDHVF